jgi:cold shock CspA family protein
MLPVPSHRPVLGRVTSYDARRGLGTVIAAGDAGIAFDFHATAIADGSRLIDPGTEVTFIVRSGRQGRYEAVGVTVVHHRSA